MLPWRGKVEKGAGKINEGEQTVYGEKSKSHYLGTVEVNLLLALEHYRKCSLQSRTVVAEIGECSSDLFG